MTTKDHQPLSSFKREVGVPGQAPRPQGCLWPRECSENGHRDAGTPDGSLSDTGTVQVTTELAGAGSSLNMESVPPGDNTE